MISILGTSQGTCLYWTKTCYMIHDWAGNLSVRNLLKILENLENYRLNSIQIPIIILLLFHIFFRWSASRWECLFLSRPAGGERRWRPSCPDSPGPAWTRGTTRPISTATSSSPAQPSRTLLPSGRLSTGVSLSVTCAKCCRTTLTRTRCRTCSSQSSTRWSF